MNKKYFPLVFTYARSCWNFPRNRASFPCGVTRSVGGVLRIVFGGSRGPFTVVEDLVRRHFENHEGISRSSGRLVLTHLQRTHGNGVADFLRTGSGVLYLQLGQERLPFAHSLRTLKLSQRAVECSFQTSFVSKQPIELFGLWNISSQDF